MPITRLLNAVSDEQPGAFDALIEAVHGDLQEMAESRMREMFGPQLQGLTLEPSALVNETFLRLMQQRTGFENRRHFFAILTKLMLRVLIDYQRRRKALKRRGDDNGVRISLSIIEAASTEHERVALEELDAALELLELHDNRKADVVRMRVVWGMTHAQIAQALDVSLATAEREWLFSKSWLLRKMEGISAGDD